MFENVSLSAIELRISSLIKWLLLIAFGYFSSIVVQFLLDRFVRTGRIDKWLLYFFFVSTPRAKTKIVFKSTQRPNIDSIKDKIIKLFAKDGLDANEKIVFNSYIFKIRAHPIPFKVSVIEPTQEGYFTVILETVGEDLLPKLKSSSFNSTINYFEKINNLLNDLQLSIINVNIKIDYKINISESLTFFDNVGDMTNKTIALSSREFSNLNTLIRSRIKQWRILFL